MLGAVGLGLAAAGEACTREAASGGGASTRWARGGTRAMTAKAGYPDPFGAIGAGASCTVASPATEGPCTEAADLDRQDVSEGLGGLPVRLVLRVVDRACAPLPGAKVKIWHARSDGSYSGQTPSPAACLKDRRDAARHYFRGVRTADARGSVAFDTCFPGWYRGRTIHVHYTISAGGAAATSQLVFEQAIVDEVFATHPDYAPFGAPDTTNAADAFLRSGALAPHTLDVARMVDGAMLVSKQLVLSS